MFSSRLERGTGWRVRVACERKADRTVVTAGGRLTASQAGLLHRALLDAFSGSPQVELSLRDVQEADLSFLQVLCAAHRTAAARRVAFLMSGLASADPVLRLISAVGAEQGAGCPEGFSWSGSAAGRSGGSLLPRSE